MNLFRDQLEQGVAEMYGLNDIKESDQQDLHEVDTQEGSNYLGFIQSQKSGGALSASTSSQPPSYFSDTYSTEPESEQEDPSRQMYVPKGVSAM